MMHTILGLLLFMLFASISLLHFYWAFGGALGLNYALPTTDIGERVINPSRLATLVVSVGLLGFASFYLIKIGFLTNTLPQVLLNYAGWFLSFVFIFRAIGDFKYVGFFKKITTTTFAEFDTKYFSYISLGIGVLAVLIELI